MATSITFDDEPAGDDGDHLNRDHRESLLVDAFVPPFGWIPCERVTERSVRLLDDSSVHSCTRLAPLYSRSLRSHFDHSAVRQGQGVTVVLDSGGLPFDPEDCMDDIHTLERIRGTVEAVDDLGDVVVRTVAGSTLRVPRSAVYPFVLSLSSSAATSTSGTKRSFEQEARVLAPYAESLLKHNLKIHSIRGDGNCLFRAASHQVYGTDEYHMIVRQACADYIMLEKAYFEPFVTEASGRMMGRPAYCGFEEYVTEIRKNGVWGDDPELQAICEIYQRPAEVYCFDRATKTARVLRKLNSDDSGRKRSEVVPIKLSFLGGGHYDSLVEVKQGFARLSFPKPGYLESLALELARTRRAGGVSLASKVSDALETEAAQVEEALLRSRQTLDNERRAHGFNLQEALELSLKSVAQDETMAMEKVRMQSLREAEDEELAMVLAESMKDASGVSNVLDDCDEDELMRLAIEESLRM